MQMRKNLYILKHFEKVKSYIFANIYHSPFDSYWNSKKSIKLKGKDDRKQNTLAPLGESVGGKKTTKDFVLFLELDVEFRPE